MDEPLWTLDGLLAATAAVADGAPVAGVSGISIDTRTIGPGELFVALKDRRDGHDFVEAAFARGAAAAVVSNAYLRKPGDGLLLRVADPLGALEQLGRAARARLAPEARVIAVTGSAGKTTTKEMLRACCARLGPTHASEKSYNNHWGVPLTLARMPAGTRYAVLEIGMSHAGEIAPLSRMARPHVAIVTTVLAAHLENFASVEDIARAKAEIFLGLGPAAGSVRGVAVLGSASPYFPILSAAAESSGARIATFGDRDVDDIRLERPPGGQMDPAEGSAPLARLKSGDRLPLALGLAGAHNLENALATLLAIHEAGGDAAEASRALAGIGAPAGRGARTILNAAGGSILLIDESYNANPGSMRAALGTLDALDRAAHPRRVAVLGDMLELGSGSARLHAELKDAIEAAGIDLLFAAGPNMRHLFDAIEEHRRGAWAETVAGIRDAVITALRSGDVVMVKGSNGSRTWQLVEVLKNESAKAPT